MTSRKTILESLTKARLLELARSIDCCASTGDTKAALVRRLNQTTIPPTELLAPLRRNDLKRVCRRLSLSDIGAAKKTLRSRILARLLKPELERQIRDSLRSQGFDVHPNRIDLPKNLDKDGLRKLHKVAVEHRLRRAKKGLFRHQEILLKRIANGTDVVPQKIKPRLVRVEANSEDELLFRYISLHWSIPVSSGYGRRLRFLVVDESNGKLIGAIGLGDPVFSLRARDTWIDWSAAQRKERLQNVMDAFLLGAVPPYSMLLCGKLVALLATSTEVRDEFRKKYDKAKSIIRGKALSARLALVTTTSALGRSSVYNRLKDDGRLALQSVGFTQGSGEFQFFNGVYDAMSQFAVACLQPTAKHTDWGSGFRNRREVVRKCLRELGLAADWLYHGIKRQVFVAPLAKNTREFLRGDHSRLFWHHRSTNEIFHSFRNRWLLPRARRNPQYRGFIRESYRLWSE